jgi:hypothetical protein
VRILFFGGRKYQSPVIGDMRKLLKDIVVESGELFFLRSSEQAKNFDRLKKQCLAFASEDKRIKSWTTNYVPDKLALLLVLREQVDNEKKVAASRESHERSTTPMNKLKRAFTKLHNVYEKCLVLYMQDMQHEENKKSRLPSLDRQEIGARVQDLIQWDVTQKDPTSCPCCLHDFTMAIESKTAINKINKDRRLESQEVGGNGKFKSVSAKHACYCAIQNCQGDENGSGCEKCESLASKGVLPVDRGPGICGFDCNTCPCVCRVVFMEHNRQKIATGILREKKRLEDGLMKVDNNPSAGKERFIDLLVGNVENRVLLVRQENDNKSRSAIFQDASSLAAMDTYSEPSIASDPIVRRGLQAAIQRSSAVNIRDGNGSTLPMTIAQARAHLKNGSSTVDHTPSAEHFISNSSSSNRISRNRLTAPPAASSLAQYQLEQYGDDDNEALNVMMAQSIHTTSGVVNTTHAHSRMNAANHQITPTTTGAVDMSLRILKRAQNYEFDPTSTPTKKKRAMRVGKGIATKNPMYTSIIDVHEAFDDGKQSQEVYSMLEQRASYEDTPERK